MFVYHPLFVCYKGIESITIKKEDWMFKGLKERVKKEIEKREEAIVSFLEVFEESPTILKDVSSLIHYVVFSGRESARGANETWLKEQQLNSTFFPSSLYGTFLKNDIFDEVPIQKRFGNRRRGYQIYQVNLSENLHFYVEAYNDNGRLGIESDYIFTRESEKEFGRKFFSFIQEKCGSSKIEMYRLTQTTFGYRPLSDAEDYVGQYDDAFFEKYLKPFEEKGFSRSLFFIGHPGTGKTTCAKKIANRGKNKSLVVFPANCLSIIGFQIVDYFQPDVFLLENIHQKEEGSTVNLLAFFENTYKRYPETHIIVTASEVEDLDNGMLRPGRVDDVLFFPLPTKEEVASLFSHFGEKYECLEKVEKQKEYLVNACAGLSPSYIKSVVESISVIEDEEFLDKLLKEKISLAHNLHPKKIKFFQENVLEESEGTSKPKRVGFYSE